MRATTRNAFGVLLIAIACTVSSCKPKETVAPESSLADEENPSTNAVPSALQQELDAAARFPLNRNPEERPAGRSAPASDRRTWALQALRQGYRATAKTNTAWDAKIDQLFEVYCDYTRITTNARPALDQALKELKDAGCTDPMFVNLQAQYVGEKRSWEQKAFDLLAAHNAMIASKYHPAFKFKCGLRAVNASRWADRRISTQKRTIWNTAHLEDVLRDTNAPPEEVFQLAHDYLKSGRAKAWPGYVLRRVRPLGEKYWSDTEPFLAFLGEAEVDAAWKARGSGYIHTVSEEGRRDFSEHIGKAAEALTRAWEMNPTNARTGYLLMQVELGQGKGLEIMRKWFRETMRIDPNNYDAAILMAFYLEPRWYGTAESSLAFARLCVASTDWGGRVPLVLAHTHRSLARFYEMAESPAYWHRPEVWKDVKDSYDKFFAVNPGEQAHRPYYARDAFNCGQYAVFLEEAEKFTSDTSAAAFGSVQAFREMMAIAIKEVEKQKTAKPRG